MKSRYNLEIKASKLINNRRWGGVREGGKGKLIHA